MKITLAVVLFWLAVAANSYFRYERPVAGSNSGAHYFVVDELLWSHARSDLGDLRLYAGQTEIPYALSTESGTQERLDTVVPVLQQAVVAGKTQFLLEMSALAEYDHVRLSLSARNYIVHARAEGSDDPHAKRWAALSDNILYDFTRENLGGWQLLRLPRSTYKYLRVTIDGPINPRDVTGATSEVATHHFAAWRDIGQLLKQEQRGK